MNVTYSEPNWLKVGRFLLDRGYLLADWEYFSIDVPFQGGNYGIMLSQQVERPKKWLFGLFTRVEKVRPILGTLYFSNPESWSFNVYGTENLQLAKSLMEELSREFNVPIEIELHSLYPMYESLVHMDYDF